MDSHRRTDGNSRLLRAVYFESQFHALYTKIEKSKYVSQNHGKSVFFVHLDPGNSTLIESHVINPSSKLENTTTVRTRVNKASVGQNWWRAPSTWPKRLEISDYFESLTLICLCDSRICAKIKL